MECVESILRDKGLLRQPRTCWRDSGFRTTEQYYDGSSCRPKGRYEALSGQRIEN